MSDIYIGYVYVDFLDLKLGRFLDFGFDRLLKVTHNLGNTITVIGVYEKIDDHLAVVIDEYVTVGVFERSEAEAVFDHAFFSRNAFRFVDGVVCDRRYKIAITVYDLGFHLFHTRISYHIASRNAITLIIFRYNERKNSATYCGVSHYERYLENYVTKLYT